MLHNLRCMHMRMVLSSQVFANDYADQRMTMHTSVASSAR